MDCSIVKSQKYPDFYVISTTDFFYPLVCDPYLQGRIGCANVLSDMYALGVVNIDNVLMILAASTNMEEKSRNIVTRKMMIGFNDCCLLANTNVTGGQSVLNPWPIIGGVAKSMCKRDDFIEPYNGRIGDVLILTKPLGTQISVNLHEWRMTDDRKYSLLKNKNITNDAIESLAFKISSGSMIRLNRNAAILMHKYDAHGATDITGFGPKGHIDNLAQNQRNLIENNINYEFYIHSLPIIAGMSKVAKFMKKNNLLNFKLIEGYSAETSGGLLIMIERKNAQKFIKDIYEMDGWQTYIVGEIREKQKYDNNEELVVFENENNMNIIEVGKNILTSNL